MDSVTTSSFGGGYHPPSAEVRIVGNEEQPRINQGTFELNLDYGEAQSVAGTFISIKDVFEEPANHPAGQSDPRIV